MKKVICLCLVLCLAAALFSGCSNKAAEGSPQVSASAAPSGSAEPAGDGKMRLVTDQVSVPVEAPADTRVMYAAPSLSDEFQIVVSDLLEANFTEGGYQYESVSAENDAVKQIEQIENAAAQGIDLIIVWPVTGEAISDACQRAMDDGTMIFSFVNNSVNWNCHRTVDVEYSATVQAEMGLEWIDEHFGKDAPEGSVNAVVISVNSDEHQSIRFRTLGEVIAADPRVNLLESVECQDDAADGQAKAENLLQKYPDTEINLWLVGAGASCTGVNAAIMAENSGVDYLEDCCIVGNNLTDEFAGYLALAEENKSVVRALAATGGSIVNNTRGIYEQSVRMLSGEEYDAYFPVGVDKVYFSNLADYGY